jgi:hypothetical protein
MQRTASSPHTGGPASLQLEITPELVPRFRHEAVIRDMPVRALILELLDIIMSDKLIDAIIDEKTQPPPRKKPGRPKKPGGKPNTGAIDGRLRAVGNRSA